MTNWGWRRWTRYSFTSACSSEEPFSWTNASSGPSVLPCLTDLVSGFFTSSSETSCTFTPLPWTLRDDFLSSALSQTQFLDPHEATWAVVRAKSRRSGRGAGSRGWTMWRLRHTSCTAGWGGFEPALRTHLEELLWIIFTSTYPKETLLPVPSHPWPLSPCSDTEHKRNTFAPSAHSNTPLPQQGRCAL